MWKSAVTVRAEHLRTPPNFYIWLLAIKLKQNLKIWLRGNFDKVISIPIPHST
jgi:hypothetical protein